MLKANTMKSWESFGKSNDSKNAKKAPTGKLEDKNNKSKLNNHSGSFSIPNDSINQSWIGTGGKYKLVDSCDPSPIKGNSHRANQLEKTEKKYTLDFDPRASASIKRGKRHESNTMAPALASKTKLIEEPQPGSSFPQDYKMVWKSPPAGEDQ